MKYIEHCSELDALASLISEHELAWDRLAFGRECHFVGTRDEDHPTDDVMDYMDRIAELIQGAELVYNISTEHDELILTGTRKELEVFLKALIREFIILDPALELTNPNKFIRELAEEFYKQENKNG